jgi:hypothetical protein
VKLELPKRQDYDVLQKGLILLAIQKIRALLNASPKCKIAAESKLLAGENGAGPEQMAGKIILAIVR